LQPVCPACHGVLREDLVVSKCNHVFHRECLRSVAVKCPKCDMEDIGGEEAIPLYGLSFGEERQTRGDLDSSGTSSENVEESNEAEKVIPKILHTERKISVLSKELATLKEKVEKVQHEEEQFRRQLVRAETAMAHKDKEFQTLKDELESQKSSHVRLLEQANRIRDRDAILEYLEIRTTKGDDQALQFIMTMGTSMLDPAPLLTEMTRLRDFYRASRTKNQRDAAIARQNELRIQREIEERQQKVDELKKKLERRRNKLQRKSSNSPASKRLHV